MAKKERDESACLGELQVQVQACGCVCACGCMCVRDLSELEMCRGLRGATRSDVREWRRRLLVVAGLGYRAWSPCVLDGAPVDEHHGMYEYLGLSIDATSTPYKGTIKLVAL